MAENMHRSKNHMKMKTITSLVHLSFIYFFIFAPYRILENIQSSINYEDGIGTISLSVLYMSYAISCLILGPPLVSILTPKWALFVSLFTHTLFIAANAYSTWITMLLASGLLGVFSPMIWISQGTYITNLALTYRKYTSEDLIHILSKFTSIFFVIYGTGGCLGSIISSVILGQQLNYKNESMVSGEDNLYSSNTSTKSMIANQSNMYLNESFRQDVCGSNYCPYMEEHSDVIQKPHILLIYILLAFLLCLNITGIILCFFIQNTELTKLPLKDKLKKIIFVMKELNLWLLVPIYYGFSIIRGTLYGSFTQSFVSCPFGVDMVGYVMTAEQFSYCMWTILIGITRKHIPRQIQFSTAVGLMILISIVWLNWTPDGDQIWIVIIMAITIGYPHAVIEIQINALTSLLFIDHPEGAFGAMQLFSSLGFCVAFATNSLLCFYIKVYHLLICLCMMLISYVLLELRIKVKERHLLKMHQTEPANMEPLTKTT